MKKTVQKTVVGVLTAAVVLSVGAVSVFAAGAGNKQNYVDSNGDSICDNAAANCACADADNDSVCDNCGKYLSKNVSVDTTGKNYADADGDGVCDNASANCRFADADNDGTCDNCQNRFCYGNADGKKGKNSTDTNQDGVCDPSGAGQKAEQGRGHCGGRNS